MKVRITDPAGESLQEIYRLYPKEVAKRIIDKVLDRAETLSTFADRGRIVEELQPMNEAHRFIIEGNYKIIYKQESNVVFVTDVFDMRQDSLKIEQQHRR